MVKTSGGAFMKKFNLIICLLLLVSCSGTGSRPRVAYRDLYELIDFGDTEYYARNNSYDYRHLKSNRYTGYYKVGKPYKINGTTYYPKEDANYKEVGIASWYGEDFHNKKTANGETYNMHDLTAAHRTLPLPCLVKVTNLENGKSLVVRVNDRGPYAKNRIIDVSKNVAKELGFYNKGTTKVKVEYLHKETNRMLRDLRLKF